MNPDSSVTHVTSYVQHFFESVCVESAAAERILRLLYPDGAKCASCGAQITGRRSSETFWAGKRTYCRGCDSKFTPTTGTMLENTHLSFAKIEVLWVLISLGVDKHHIAQLAGVHVDTVTIWQSKIAFWGQHV